jgi:hypothetical protein
LSLARELLGEAAMSRRAIALRLAIAASLAATVATSRIPDEIEAATEAEIAAPGTSRIEIRLNAAAAAEATSLELDFELVSSSGDVDLLVVPDDESLEPFGLAADTLFVNRPCPEPGDCIIGFSIDAAGDGVATVSVTARMLQGSGLDDFSPDASLEVIVVD